MSKRQNLISVRKKAGFTQAEIASKLEISERQYYLLEVGASYGSVQNWQKLKEITKERQNPPRLSGK